MIDMIGIALYFRKRAMLQNRIDSIVGIFVREFVWVMCFNVEVTTT